MSKSLSPITDRLGQIIGASIIDRDITAEVMAEKMADEAAQRPEGGDIAAQTA